MTPPGVEGKPMSTTKVFLASSSELKEDREQFEIFINRKNRDWVNNGVFLDLVIWEDFLDAMSQTRLQEIQQRNSRLRYFCNALLDESW